VPVLGRFIVDLLAAEVRLVVEVDGGYHAQRARADARRDRALGRAGYRVLRLEAELVMGDLDAAVARVAGEVERLRSQDR
jgi:very-short-patch-repair endonuclease